MINEQKPITSATRQVRQRWFSVCIFLLGLFFGLTGNRPQSTCVRRPKLLRHEAVLNNCFTVI